MPPKKVVKPKAKALAKPKAKAPAKPKVSKPKAKASPKPKVSAKAKASPKPKTSGKNQLPPLYNVDVKGKERVWTVYAKGNLMIKEHGIVDGKMITVERECKGKNIGRSNETTDEEQAKLEAERAWQSQLDKGYAPKDKKNAHYQKVAKQRSENNNTNMVMKKGQQMAKVDRVYQPMLAQKFTNEPKVLKYLDFDKGVYVQPKLDGIRCIAYRYKGKIILQSRQGKQFVFLESLRKKIDEVMGSQSIVLDGEIFVRKIPEVKEIFRAITSSVRTSMSKPGEYEDYMEYHVYDCICPDSFAERYANLKKLKWNKRVKLVETHKIKDVEGADKYREKYESEDYEGAMIREGSSKYEEKKRSHYLLKYKTMEDKEYKVVGYEEGKGTEKGCVVWQLITPKGVKFNARPKGSFEERKELLKDVKKNPKKYINKKATIRFQEFVKGDVPRFPVFVAFRDYE